MYSKYNTVNVSMAPLILIQHQTIKIMYSKYILKNTQTVTRLHVDKCPHKQTKKRKIKNKLHLLTE